MPSVKDLAHLVINENWPLGDLAFERAWNDLRDHPLIITTGPSNQPALAAASTTKDKAIVVMAIFVFVLERITDDTTIRDLLPLFEKTAVALGDKGSFIRIKNTLDAAYTGDTIIAGPRAFAIAYTHEYPNGKPLNQEEVEQLWSTREALTIAIYHERNLPEGITGKVYAGKRNIATTFSDKQYCLLRQLLKYKMRIAERSTPAMAKRCWPHEEEMRGSSGTDESRYRTMIWRLKNTLQESVGMTIIEAQRAVYSIEPWPATYCVIEETARAHEHGTTPDQASDR